MEHRIRNAFIATWMLIMFVACSGGEVLPEDPETKPTGSMTISTKTVDMDGKGGTFELTINSNIGYKIELNVDWVKEVKSKTVKEYLHTFEVLENPETKSRSGVVIVCSDEGVCIPVTVNQKGKIDEQMAWVEETFWHKSLAIRFTADWCGYCPTMASSFAEVQNKKPGKLEVMHIHSDGSLYFKAGDSLFKHYKVEGYPSGFVDGRSEVWNYEPNVNYDKIVKVIEETEKKYGTQSGIGFKSNILDGDKVSVELKLYLKKADKYKVTVVLLESNIVGYQSGQGNNYVHNDVARLSLTDMTGDKFTTDEANVIKEFTYQGVIPSNCNRENLRILVYVERAYGKQTVISSGDFGEYYVDNALSESVGTEAVLKFVE